MYVRLLRHTDGQTFIDLFFNDVPQILSDAGNHVEPILSGIPKVARGDSPIYPIDAFLVGSPGAHAVRLTYRSAISTGEIFDVPAFSEEVRGPSGAYTIPQTLTA